MPRNKGGPRPPLRLGLTGNIASGKSEVARHLQGLGCLVIDADKAAHDLYRERPTLVPQLVGLFGSDILAEDGSLDRKALGALVFSNSEALAALNAVVRPPLQAALRGRIDAGTSHGHDVVLDAALIVEWGWEKDFDALWLVVCREDQRVGRLVKYRGLSEAEAWQRVASQMPESRKRDFATVILENEGDLGSLIAQVDIAWKEIRSQP